MWAENVCQHLAARRTTNWRAQSNEVSIAKGLNRFLLCIASVAECKFKERSFAFVWRYVSYRGKRTMSVIISCLCRVAGNGNSLNDVISRVTRGICLICFRTNIKRLDCSLTLRFSQLRLLYNTGNFHHFLSILMQYKLKASLEKVCFDFERASSFSTLISTTQNVMRYKFD